MLDECAHWRHLANAVERLCAVAMTVTICLSAVATRPVSKLLYIQSNKNNTYGFRRLAEEVGWYSAPRHPSSDTSVSRPVIADTCRSETEY